MVYKILFSYIFDDEINRVYKIIKDLYLLKDLAFNGINFDYEYIKGENNNDKEFKIKIIFKEINLYFYLINSYKTSNYKIFNFKVKGDSISEQFLINIELYSCTIEKKTFLTFNIIIQDSFLIPFFNDKFNEKEKNLICEKLNNYIKSTTKYMQIKIGTSLNTSLKNIWNLFNEKKGSENFLHNIKFHAEIKGQLETIGSLIYFYVFDNIVDNKFENEKLIALFQIKYVFLKENKIELILNNNQNNLFIPKINLILKIIYLDENYCFLNFSIRALNYINSDLINFFEKYIKKTLLNIKEYIKKTVQK
jgi:hypothetical protein